MFLRNAWYVAARDRDVADKPMAVTMLGEKLVIYRKTDGSLAALEDACAHRKLPLSMGRVQGDEIECGYHGMVYDCSGRCTRIPYMDRMPTGARVRSYPIAVRNGLAWVWMGEAAKADPATIFAVEHWDDPTWGCNEGGELTIACNYLYVTDNLLDPSHVSWVHQSSFAGSACEDTPLDVAVTDTGVTVSRWMMDVEPAPFYQPFLKFAGRCDRKQQYEVRYPSHALIRAIFTPAGSGGAAREAEPPHPDVFLMDSYNFMTPVDENTTRYFWFQMRNFAPGDADVSRRFTESVRAAFDEDRVVLEAVHKGMAEAATPPIALKIDVGPNRFRRRVEQMIEAERKDLAAAA